MQKNYLKRDFEEIFKENIEWNNLKGKRVLITGATGMIASYLVYFLCFLREIKKIEVNILIQGRSYKKAHERFADFLGKDYFEFRTDNLMIPLTEMPACDYIIHAASLASPQYYFTMPIEVAEPNAIGTYNLLKYAVECGCKSFLYFSSGDIYGKIENADCITENDMGIVNPLDIHSCYSESKRMGETWCKVFAHEKNIRTVIARIGHTYGPTMNIEEDPRVFASFMKALIHEKDIVMYSDGMAKRPFCYLSDATTAFFLLLFKGGAGEAYNVCNSNEFLSMNELAHIILELKKDKCLKLIHTNRSVSDKYVDNKDNKANKPVDWKIRTLGWNPKVSVATGFSRTLEYLEGEKRNEKTKTDL